MQHEHRINQHFLNLLIGLFTSTRIITDIPNSSKGKLIRLLKNIFFSDDSKGQVAQNGIYRDFLMKLEKMVQHNTCTRSELEMLSFNLQYIEGECITGLIPYPDNDTTFISNTRIVELIQAATLKRHNIPPISTKHTVSFNTVAELGNGLLKKSYGKVKKNRTHKSRSPYSRKPPCKYGSKCYHQHIKLHTDKYGHSPSPKKSPSKKGGKRKSKKTYQCVRQTLKKYTSRGSPPYPAQECPNKRKKGNDGRMYVSKPNDTNGIFRWVIT